MNWTTQKFSEGWVIGIVAVVVAVARRLLSLPRSFFAAGFAKDGVICGGDGRRLALPPCFGCV